MMLYSKKSVKTVSFFIALALWAIILLLCWIWQNSGEEEAKPSTSITLKAEETQNTNREKSAYELLLESSMQTSETTSYSSYPWRIEIPKIQLNAPIYEGTDAETLRKGVGHFEDTSIWEGNICLAAHNRGYKYNYFQDIVLLEVGDEIIYQTPKGKKTYVVQENKKIKETNVSYIQRTKENKLTLITCEKNEKEYRRCVQAVQKEI